jgi:hypothetical protein
MHWTYPPTDLSSDTTSTSGRYRSSKRTLYKSLEHLGHHASSFSGGEEGKGGGEGKGKMHDTLSEPNADEMDLPPSHVL